MMEFRFGIKHRIYNWNMRTARERLGLSQKQLGDIVGIGLGTISQYETLRDFPEEERAELIAQALGMSKDTLFPDWLREFKLERVQPHALDTSISASEAIRQGLISNTLLITDGSEFEDEIDRNMLPGLIAGVLEQALTQREKRVIELRFGLEDGQARTSEEVGNEFCVSRTRILQIEAKALRKLRHPLNSRGLRELL